jgi:hypothetical protein
VTTSHSTTSPDLTGQAEVLSRLLVGIAGALVETEHSDGVSDLIDRALANRLGG